ncbi:hypothetical protein Tco_0480467, partial [Tanacetum coccineum]
MWICFRDHERRTMKGSYMGFADFLQVRYVQQKIDDTTRERRYYECVASNYEFSKHRTLTSTTLNDHFPYDTNNPIPKEHLEQEENEQLSIRPRPWNYSFEEWLKIRIGHNNLHESDREFIFNELILDSYDVEEEYAREIGDPYSRRFDEYNRVFKNEIEHLSNEYILRIGKTGFICITDRENKSLPLGCVNGARFKDMIGKELEGNKYVHKNLEAKRQFSRPARPIIIGNLAEIAAVTAQPLQLRRNHYSYD